MTTVKIKEAAEYLGVSEYTIRKMCKAKELPHLFVGGVYLFRVKSLDEWMDELEKESILKSDYSIYSGIGRIAE